jgi:hypothetical protein
MNARNPWQHRCRMLSLAAGLVLILGALACDDGAKGTSVEPGVGATATGVSIRIGDARSAVVARLGQPASARDLGGVGTLLSFPDRHLSCLVSGAADTAAVTAVYLGAGFEGRTPGGVGIGSGRADVTAEFPNATIDPFLGTWRHAATGIAFDWDGDLVASITVFGAGG